VNNSVEGYINVFSKLCTNPELHFENQTGHLKVDNLAQTNISSLPITF